MKVWSLGFGAKLCLYLFFSLLPLQVNVLIYDAGIYHSGFFNPYLAHFVYLNDFLLLAAAALYFFGGGKWGPVKEFEKLVVIFCAGIFLSLAFADQFVNSFFYALRSLEFLLLFFLLSRKVIDMLEVVGALVVGMVVPAVLGILQFVFQQSVGLKFIGEPVISKEMLGVAKLEIGPLKLLRAYGTFPHPNVFGGFSAAALGGALYLQARKLVNVKVGYLLVGLFVFGLLLSFSRSAMLAVLIVGALYFVKGRKVPRSVWIGGAGLGVVLLLRFVFDADFSERMEYFAVAFSMALSEPLGVGIGNFTAVMQDFYALKLEPWLFQPVHNVFVLIMNELGIIGAIVTGCLAWRLMDITKKRPVFFYGLILIATVGMFDHYFWSLYQGQAFMWSYLGLVAADIR